jgi:mRNA-degrading endonuclease RelE of RelBE toxin-antitoxin system
MALHPDAGDIMPGTGGARKVRFSGRGKGKSGGYRVITFFAADDIPVFLIDVYSKPTCRRRNATK